MFDWVELVKITERKLDRKLEQQEVDFLKWVYTRQMTEETVELE